MAHKHNMLLNGGGGCVGQKNNLGGRRTVFLCTVCTEATGEAEKTVLQSASPPRALTNSDEPLIGGHLQLDLFNDFDPWFYDCSMLQHCNLPKPPLRHPCTLSIARLIVGFCFCNAIIPLSWQTPLDVQVHCLIAVRLLARPGAASKT